MFGLNPEDMAVLVLLGVILFAPRFSNTLRKPPWPMTPESVIGPRLRPVYRDDQRVAHASSLSKEIFA
jgi:hypothetical protein